MLFVVVVRRETQTRRLSSESRTILKRGPPLRWVRMDAEERSAGSRYSGSCQVRISWLLDGRMLATMIKAIVDPDWSPRSMIRGLDMSFGQSRIRSIYVLLCCDFRDRGVNWKTDVGAARVLLRSPVKLE